ncbi:MAG: hypothetical protein J7M12_06210, partial [Candidatus Hydrogenedentes bacterium]|nr:hypothetical protein [Candidatus Hydrogenedentota bacterium]
MYVVGPADQPFAAHSGRLIRVKLTVSTGASGSIYFTTTDTAAFSEQRRISFPINADNCPHEYIIEPAANREWSGTIARLRLDIDGTDPGSTVRVHSFRVEQPPPKLEICSFHTDTALIHPGQNVRITARIANTGGVDLTDLDINLYVPPEVIVVDGKVHTTGKTLSIGDSMMCTWTVRPPEDGIHIITISVLGQPDVSATEHLTMAPCGSMPATAPPFETMHAEWTRTGAVVLTNQRLCLYVARDGGKYGPMGLYLRYADGRPANMAAFMPQFARVELDNGTLVDVFPNVSRLNRGRYQGKPFVQASFTAVFDFGSVDVFFSVNETDPWIAATYTLTANRDLSVTRFSGPTLLAGEGGFGRAKRGAIFPGIEDLVAGEKSSADTDALTAYQRFAPDPDKVTIPYMAVRYDDTVVQLMWPPRDMAGTGWNPLTAVFSSPNQLDDQNNHLMELFAPGGRSFVKENQRRAFVPVNLAAGEQLVINAKLALYQPTRKGMADAVRVWQDAYGVPPVPPPPRLTEDALGLCAKAYIDTCWDDKTRGWRPHLSQNGPKPRFMADAVVSLIMAGLTAKDNKVAEQCRDRVR